MLLLVTMGLLQTHFLEYVPWLPASLILGELPMLEIGLLVREAVVMIELDI